MGFKLFWTDPNLAEQGHKVYRDTSTMDPNSLPTEIADLAADVVEYDDADNALVDSTTYYYRVSAYVTGTEKVSDEVTLTADDSSDEIAGDALFYYLMDAITGTTITDDLGLNDATIVNGASQVTFGSTGYALQFNGTNQMVALPHVKTAGSTYPQLTVGCWFRTSAGQNQILISFDRSEFYRMEIGGESGGNSRPYLGVSVATDQGVFDMAGVSDVVDGEWHLAVMSFDAGVVSLYLDGFLENSYNTGGTAIGDHPESVNEDRYGFLGVGSEASTFNGSTGPDYWFAGDMTKAFELYRAMAPEEIAAMYNRGPEI